MPEQHYRPGTYRARGSLGYLLRRVYTIMHERIEAAFASHEFTLMQWIVLIYLRDGLARTASDIAREFRHDSGALTRVIDQLERRGLLTRHRSTTDRRLVDLGLTAKGTKTIEELLPVMAGQLNEALAPFTRAEFEQMRDLMERLVDHLQRLPPPAQASPAAASARAPKVRRVSRPAAPRRRRRS
ncbi:MAG: MarR family transcriptional regulator [Gammaproteobacteria bacterium]|nr:MarR family transcriptional regulator [Gammaproteobacteria bacterium]